MFSSTGLRLLYVCVDQLEKCYFARKTCLRELAIGFFAVPTSVYSRFRLWIYTASLWKISDHWQNTRSGLVLLTPKCPLLALKSWFHTSVSCRTPPMVFLSQGKAIWIFLKLKVYGCIFTVVFSPDGFINEWWDQNNQFYPKNISSVASMVKRWSTL